MPTIEEFSTSKYEIGWSRGYGFAVMMTFAYHHLYSACTENGASLWFWWTLLYGGLCALFMLHIVTLPKPENTES